MKKILLTCGLLSFMAMTSCDPKDKQQDGENAIEQTDLKENDTPEQYQGSTGVEEGDNNNLEAEENIELKKQTFKGSFSSEFTQTYNFTVLNESTYHFKLETENSAITYTLKKENGEVVIDATKEDASADLAPGDYVIHAALDENANQNDKNTEFKILID